MDVQSYRDLQVWQKAIQFVCDCYRVSTVFPKHETYGLSSQLRRAVVSIPANVAEGHGRTSTREFLYHLSVAYGSLMEVETHLIISEKLQYLPTNEVQPLLNQSAEVGQMLNGLMASLQRKLD